MTLKANSGQVDIMLIGMLNAGAATSFKQHLDAFRTAERTEKFAPPHVQPQSQEQALQWPRL
jgi:hypothetical protein